MKVFAVILVTVSIFSCSGWQLRGAGSHALKVDSVYLKGRNSPTYQLIEEHLKQNNILAHAPDAAFHLVIGDENIQRKTASLNQDGFTAEYELVLTINYKILDAQQKVLRPESALQLFRSYRFDQNDVVAGDKEELILRREIRSEASRQIIQQLRLLQR